MSKQTIIWRICDGKPGHDNQSKALFNAFSALLECEEFTIDANIFNNGLVNYFLKKFPPGVSLPPPDIIMGAGHKTHLSLLCAKHAFRGKTVLLMKPSLPVFLFDWCIIPAHDNPPNKGNIIVTNGAPNLLKHSKKLSASTGLILVGGPSKHYLWDTKHLISQINEIIEAQPHIIWKIADSRRTPEGCLTELKSLAGENIKIIEHETTANEEFTKLYESAGIVWVTEDSVSMLYEALSCGCRVGLLNIPTRKVNKISQDTSRLIQDRMITSFYEWQKTRQMPLNKTGFNEATRCAKLLIDKGILI